MEARPSATRGQKMSHKQRATSSPPATHAVLPKGGSASHLRCDPKKTRARRPDPMPRPLPSMGVPHPACLKCVSVSQSLCPYMSVPVCVFETLRAPRDAAVGLSLSVCACAGAEAVAKMAGHRPPQWHFLRCSSCLSPSRHATRGAKFGCAIASRPLPKGRPRRLKDKAKLKGARFLGRPSNAESLQQYQRPKRHADDPTSERRRDGQRTQQSRTRDHFLASSRQFTRGRHGLQALRNLRVDLEEATDDFKAGRKPCATRRRAQDQERQEWSSAPGIEGKGGWLIS